MQQLSGAWITSSHPVAERITKELDRETESRGRLFGGEVSNHGIVQKRQLQYVFGHCVDLCIDLVGEEPCYCCRVSRKLHLIKRHVTHLSSLGEPAEEVDRDWSTKVVVNCLQYLSLHCLDLCDGVAIISDINNI